MENEFKFINQKEIYQYKFYMIPKELFVNERYTSLSPTAILLYGILLDRLTLSIKNKKRISIKKTSYTLYFNMSIIEN